MNMSCDNTIEAILKSTTKLKFPFGANEFTKRCVLHNAKKEIDDKLVALVADEMLFEKKKEELWIRACNGACEEFESLPSKLRLNSFYFQEVMHRYVELMKATFEL